MARLDIMRSPGDSDLRLGKPLSYIADFPLRDKKREIPILFPVSRISAKTGNETGIPVLFPVSVDFAGPGPLPFAHPCATEKNFWGIWAFEAWNLEITP